MQVNKTIILIWLLLVGLIPCIPTVSQSSKLVNSVKFRETVWLQTPRHLFVSGEQIEFHAFLLEKDTYKPSVLSKYIRVELLDSTGNKLQKQNLELANAQVAGSFVLSAELKSGWYYLRAYTNWMRNFPETEFTAIPFKVVNPADTKRYLVSPIEKTYTDPATLKTGMTLTDLPDYLIVKSGNFSTKGSSAFRVLIHRSYSWYWFETKTLAGDTITFKVPKNKIPEGIVQISIVADNDTVWASQLWSNYDLNQHQVAVNLPFDTIGLNSNQQADYQMPKSFTNEEMVGLNILINQCEPENQSSSFLPGLPGWSCDTRIPSNNTGFKEWLKNNRYPDECVQSFFTPGSSGPVVPEVINLPFTEQKNLQFFPETRAGIVSGRVIDILSGQPVPSIGISITILNNNRFEVAKTNRNGVFNFSLPGIRNSNDFILSFISEPDSGWTIEVFPEYDIRTFKPRYQDFNLSQDELEYAGTLSINRQLKQIYEQPLSQEDSRTDTLIKRKPFYGTPDRIVNTNDYIELANVLEVVYEVVPDVQVRRQGNQIRLSVYNKSPFAHDYETLILLDGIPLTNQKELLELPPSRIKTIEVKNKIYIHGNYIFAAVVNFISLNNDFAGLKLPAKSVVGSIDLPALSHFSTGTKNSANNFSTPVLDPILLWSQSVTPIESRVFFSTNDLPGQFKLMIYGFDKNGNWLFGQKTFEVNNPIP